MIPHEQLQVTGIEYAIWNATWPSYVSQQFSRLGPCRDKTCRDEKAEDHCKTHTPGILSS